MQKVVLLLRIEGVCASICNASITRYDKSTESTAPVPEFVCEFVFPGGLPTESTDGWEATHLEFLHLISLSEIREHELRSASALNSPASVSGCPRPRVSPPDLPNRFGSSALPPASWLRFASLTKGSRLSSTERASLSSCRPVGPARYPFACWRVLLAPRSSSHPYSLFRISSTSFLPVAALCKYRMQMQCGVYTPGHGIHVHVKT